MSTLRLVVFSGDLLQNKSEILIKKRHHNDALYVVYFCLK